MKKQQLLQELRNKLEKGEVNSSEILELIQGASETAPVVRKESHVNMSTVLYFLGGGIALIGLVVLITQRWDLLTSPMRIMVTLGSAAMMYVAGTLLYRDTRFMGVASALHFIAIPLFPVGILVAIHEFNPELVERISIQVSTIGLVLATYVLTFYMYRRGLFLVAVMLYATLFYFGVTEWLALDMPHIDEARYVGYRFFALGISYIAIAIGLSRSRYRWIREWGYGFGSLALLGSALGLGGYQPNASLFWELSYPALLWGVYALSVRLRSWALLFFAAVFTIGYIAKITSEYFADSLGWPLALVIVGFVLIGVGFVVVRVHGRIRGSRD